MSSHYARKRAIKKLGAWVFIGLIGGGMAIWYFSSAGPGAPPPAPRLSEVPGPEADGVALNGGDYYGDAISELRRALVAVERNETLLSDQNLALREADALMRAEQEASAALVGGLAAEIESLRAELDALRARVDNVEGAAMTAPSTPLAGNSPARMTDGDEGGYGDLFADGLASLGECALAAVSKGMPRYLIDEIRGWDASLSASESELVARWRALRDLGLAKICFDHLMMSVDDSKGRRNESYRAACYSYFIRSAVVAYSGRIEGSSIRYPFDSYREYGFYHEWPIRLEADGADYELTLKGDQTNPWLWGISHLDKPVDAIEGDDYWGTRWLGRYISTMYGESACKRWRPDLFGDEMRYAPWDGIEPDERDVAMIEGLRGTLWNFDLTRPTDEMLHLSRLPFQIGAAGR